MSQLVDKLCAGDHPVELSLWPERNIQALKDCLDRGYVHLRFTQTRGGTELGFRVDREQSRIDAASIEGAAGAVRLAGYLTLDYVKVKCVGDIDLTTLSGTGHLERVMEQPGQA
jgi:hypothetical protein